MTMLEIELDTTVLEDEWEYKCVRDSIVENLQKVFDMSYVTCLCCNYGWGGSPVCRVCEGGFVDPVSRGVGQCDACNCEFFNVEDLEEWQW